MDKAVLDYTIRVTARTGDDIFWHSYFLEASPLSLPIQDYQILVVKQNDSYEKLLISGILLIDISVK